MVDVAVGNIQGLPLMPQKDVRTDMTLLFSLGVVIMACEVKVSRYNRAFREIAQGLNRRVFFEKYEVQIALPHSWNAVCRTYRLSRGLVRINPARWFNAVFCMETKTIYVTTHFTNAAWNDKPKRRKAWRKRTWLRQESAARALIKGWTDAGWNVVVAGDLNTGTHMPNVDFHPDQVTAARAGLMHLIVIPAPGNEAVVKDEQVIPNRRTKGDHPLVRASVGFRKAAA